MNYCPPYAKACVERDVPIEVIEKVYDLIKDKSPEEQDAIRVEWAKKIEETYPYKPGCDPHSKQLRREVWRQGKVDSRNWLDKLDDLTDEEITSLVPYIANFNCYHWIVEDRVRRPEVSDRQRLEEVRDKVVEFYGNVELQRPLDV